MADPIYEFNIDIKTLYKLDLNYSPDDPQFC